MTPTKTQAKPDLAEQIAQLDERIAATTEELDRIANAEASFASRKRDALFAGDAQAIVKLDGEREMFDANRATVELRRLHLKLQRARLRQQQIEEESTHIYTRFTDAKERFNLAQNELKLAERARSSASTRRNSAAGIVKACEKELEEFERKFNKR